MLEEGSAGDILLGKLGIYKGAVFENIVADALCKAGKPFYYFRKDSGLEVDFVSRVDGDVSLIEVKATSGRTKSSDTIMKNPDRYGPVSCIKLGECNVGTSGSKLTLPYYMSMFL